MRTSQCANRQTVAFLLRKKISQPFRAQAPLADQNSGVAIAEPATSFPSEKGRIG